MRRKSPLEEWVEIIEGALVMALLAALFPLLAFCDGMAAGGAR